MPFGSAPIPGVIGLELRMIKNEDLDVDIYIRDVGGFSVNKRREV